MPQVPTAGAKNGKTAGNGKSNKTKKSPAKKKPVREERELSYPEPTVELKVGELALTVEEAKQMIGWVEETEDDKFGDDYFILDVNERKIRCTNNVHNRPFYMGVAGKLRQDILNNRWRFNGEPIIIGKTGLVLDGQHTLVALITAAQEWHNNREVWTAWESEPVIEKLVSYGVSEADEVVNTINTGKPRSLTDVIYRSEFFAKYKSKDRRNVSRITDYAVRLLWERTGAKTDAHCPYRTHAESLDFITRHSKILEAVRHIYDENEQGKVEKYLTPGYASALLYLMGTCATDSGEYINARSEAVVKFEHWDKALEFWTCLAGGDQSLVAVKKALNALLDDGCDNKATRTAIIVKAWECFLEGKNATPTRLELLYETDEDGNRKLVSVPYLGGLDVGPNMDDIVVPGDEVEDEDEVKARAEAERVAKLKALAAKESSASGAKKGRPKEGDEVWVYGKDPAGDWPGEVIELYRGPRGMLARVKVRNGHPQAGKVEEVKFDTVHHERRD